MLDRLIRLSLSHRAIVLGAAALLLAFGVRTASELPVEVLPDLTKPTVIILTEAPGLAPEEVETLVTVPLERALNGVQGVTRLRSTSDVSLSLIFVEFDWGADIYTARNFVRERLAGIEEVLPDGVSPFMTPVASLMGEIMLIGLRSSDGAVSPAEVRSIADWQVRPRLQGLAGIAEVLGMGGGVRQIQVQPDPERMRSSHVTFDQLRSAAAEAASNTTGGFLDSGSQEIMMRNLAMTTDLDAIGATVVKHVNDRAVRIADVADVVWGTEPMRGDAAVDGTPGVILSVTKAGGVDTRKLTAEIERVLAELRPTLPEGVEMVALFRQTDFINNAVGNLWRAIVEGAAMVVVVLFLFLLSARTTLITLTAIPLSFSITVLVFWLLDISVNSMTLGGLAVAVGMVVDDAIVDVENVFRRLRENALSSSPLPKLEVVARASTEVRGSILYATAFVVLVFVPLLALSGVAGRLFSPIAVATITSMIASFVVSLTVVPVLCSILLKPKPEKSHRDGPLVRLMKAALRNTWLRLALDAPFAVLAVAAVLVSVSLAMLPTMGRDFLPSFNEETALVAMAAAPGTSLKQTNELADIADRLLRSVPEVRRVGRRLGRAERGDHVVPVSTVEFDIDFEFEEDGRSRPEVLDDIRGKMRTIPGTFAALSGPLADRIGHMLSGVSAKIAIKVFGPDLDVNRRLGEQIQGIAKDIPGLEDARIEQQAPIPQLRIEIDRERAVAYGVTPGGLNAQLSALVGGERVGDLFEGQRTLDLVLRLPPAWRESPDRLGDMLIDTGSGARVPLRSVADIRYAKGPNVIGREKSQRRFVVSINPTERDSAGLVERLKREIEAKVSFPEGYHPSYEGEYIAQQEASQRIAWSSAAVLAVIGLLLFGFFRTQFFAVQVLCDVPLALVGGLALTWYMLGNISIATLVGLIAVAGVAARNSVMMLSHYLHVIRVEGEPFSRSMVERATLERLVPVLMTALAAGIALLPLVFAAGQPGKEILHPVAVVIVGGLLTSTLLGLGVTPAVFYAFGRKAAARSVAEKSSASA